MEQCGVARVGLSLLLLYQLSENTWSKIKLSMCSRLEPGAVLSILEYGEFKYSFPKYYLKYRGEGVF